MSVFISYNWRAKAFAEATCSLLASAGISYWRDDEQVRPGDVLFQRLAEGISACSVVLVFLTPEYVGSENCAREIQLATDYHRPRLVLKLPGIACPPSVGAGAFAAQIAFALSGTTWMGTDGVTPPAGELLPALTALGIAAAPPSSAPTPPRPLLRTIPWEELQPSGDVRGSGTYGTVRVYAWTARGGMAVAVKELSRAAASVLSPADVASFQREAHLQLHLEHDSVARVYALADGGEGADRRLGLVMKLYERPVSAVLGGAHLPAAMRAAFVLQIASGLAYMHGEGVVHGDLKPDNVLLASGGTEVALTDFGCSTLKLAGSMTSGTNKGAGTPAFKAPELFEEDAHGNPVHGASPAADVYAFALTAWCLLADSVTPYPLRDAAGVPINVARRVPAGLRPGEGLAGKGVPTEWIGLLERCWTGSAAARPGMGDVLALVKGIVGQVGVGELERMMREVRLATSNSGTTAMSSGAALSGATVPLLGGGAVHRPLFLGGEAAQLPVSARRQPVAPVGSAPSMFRVEAAGGGVMAGGTTASLTLASLGLAGKCYAGKQATHANIEKFWQKVAEKSGLPKSKGFACGSLNLYSDDELVDTIDPLVKCEAYARTAGAVIEYYADCMQRNELTMEYK